MARRIELTGKRFGRLLVVGDAEPSFSPAGYRMRRVHVRCDCGQDVVVFSGVLSRGDTRSCGCLRSETTAAQSYKHGDAARGKIAPELVCWGNMIRRCEEPTNRKFAHYGGRGIRVCERWRGSYPAFLADMGRRPSPLHSIDRKDNDLDYYPDNCRWATKSEQMKNRRPGWKAPRKSKAA